MTDATPLDIAHAAMMADESDDAARLRFYERMADVELFLLLEDEPDADQISPVLLDDAYVLVFFSIGLSPHSCVFYIWILYINLEPFHIINGHVTMVFSVKPASPEPI